MDGDALVDTLRAACIAKDAEKGVKGTALYAAHSIELHPDLRKAMFMLMWKSPPWNEAKELDAIKTKLSAAKVPPAVMEVQLTAVYVRTVGYRP